MKAYNILSKKCEKKSISMSVVAPEITEKSMRYGDVIEAKRVFLCDFLFEMLTKRLRRKKPC